MLPDGLHIPTLREPYQSALRDCIEYAFSTYKVVGFLASGTVVRGDGDARSDLDIHVLHGEDFRERVQRWFSGVPCEIFVNPPYRVPDYFEEDRADRRPIAPHMFATGVVIYDLTGEVAELVSKAVAILENPPEAPNPRVTEMTRYSAATEFEDVLDLAERDPSAAAVLLGSAVRKLAECRISVEAGWLPRAKDLMVKLGHIDPESAALARLAASDISLSERISAAKELCIRVTGSDGFFEWKSPREQLTKT